MEMYYELVGHFEYDLAALTLLEGPKVARVMVAGYAYRHSYQIDWGMQNYNAQNDFKRYFTQFFIYLPQSKDDFQNLQYYLYTSIRTHLNDVYTHRFVQEM